MSYFANPATARPETALGDLIAEQTMYPVERPDCDDLPRRRPARRFCSQCGGYGSHHVHCPNYED